jgi:fluoride exporter
MKDTLLVGLGGAIGAMIRFGISNINTNNRFVFPIHTFCINVLGSFILGYVCTLALPTSTQRFWAIGICGGFTTFSTFSKEAITLWQQQQYTIFVGYILLSMLLGLAAFYLGLQCNITK